ncbi:glutamate synthase (NADPH/NADH) small chain [Parelusimicrobium proximum]|uniref:NADPH-dependent glutamate synthase n=1 Tax=Parelusimicrobium proximum TaxID=3228953 RepID=UPI003D1750D2
MPPNPSAPRQHGDRQTPEERRTNFDEVVKGFTKEEALKEADRCLNCPHPRCSAACPVNVQIPQFIQLLLKDNVGEAASKIMETSLLPAICGRVCPQENHCEGACILKGKFQPVAVGMLERYVADTARAEGLLTPPKQMPPTGKKVACVGSGPSSLSAAAELKRLGHDVTVFEALHDFGGVLRYGIPTFRLPREIINKEIDTIRQMGVKFIPDILVGATITVDELKKEFDAVYIGSGAGLPVMAGIKGENAVGVYSANEFLTRVNLMAAHADHTDTPLNMGKKIVVLGGGNSAMDAARCAARLSPDSVTVVYRRGKEEMPAREEERENALEEGVKFELQAIQKEILTDDKGKVKALVCHRTKLGEPDEKGRRRPVIVEGADFTIECDTVIVAIGQKPNPIIPKTTPGLETNERGVLEITEKGATSMEGVYAGGDIVRGGATVLLAMKDGIIAASKINMYLEGK